MGEVTEISEYDFFVTVLSETVRRGGQAKKSTELTKVLFFARVLIQYWIWRNR